MPITGNLSSSPENEDEILDCSSQCVMSLHSALVSSPLIHIPSTPVPSTDSPSPTQWEPNIAHCCALVHTSFDYGSSGRQKTEEESPHLIERWKTKETCTVSIQELVKPGCRSVNVSWCWLIQKAFAGLLPVVANSKSAEILRLSYLHTASHRVSNQPKEVMLCWINESWEGARFPKGSGRSSSMA